MGEASIGACSAYKKGIVLLNTLFVGRWPVLLAADLVVRAERWRDLKEDCDRQRPDGYFPERPWEYIIAASAYGGVGCTNYWEHFVKLPLTLASTNPDAARRVAELEGVDAPGRAAPPPGAPSAPPKGAQPRLSKKQRRAAERARSGARVPAAPAPPAPAGRGACLNWNFKKGSCEGDAACAFERPHVCSVCGGQHRAVDQHPGATDPKAKGDKGKGKGKGGKAR